MPTLYKKKSSTKDLEDILAEITSKTQRLEEASGMPPVTMPKPEESMLMKGINILSTGQKLSAKTARDLLKEGQLPTMDEYKQMLDPNKSYSYDEVLGELGMQDDWKRKLLGFGLDVGLDPTTYIGLGTIGKGLSKVSKAGEALPLLGKGFKAVNKGVSKAGALAKQARGIMPFMDSGSNELHALTMGTTAEAGHITKGLMEKYPDVYKNISKLDPNKFKLIDEASEKFGKKGFKALLADMSPEEQAFTRAWHYMKKDTGAEKLTMGTVKGLIGDTQGVKQLPLFGEISDTGNIMDELTYEPHYWSQEWRDFMKTQTGTTEEAQKIMGGLAKKNIYTKEKSRTLIGTINELNNASMEKYGKKMFEDDPGKIVENYTYSFAKKKAQYNLVQEAMKVTDDLGNPIIKPLTEKTANEGMVKLTGLPFKEGYEATPEVAKIMNRVSGVFASDEMTSKFMKGYDKALNAFKYGVTVPWPTFNINNLMGAMFNNFIYSSSSVLDPKNVFNALDAMKGKPGMIVAKNGTKATLKEVSEKLERYGLLNTFTKMETGVGELAGKAKAILKPISNIPNNVEKFVRTNLAIDVFQKTGDWQQVYKAVSEVHGNYSKEFLPAFEKNVMARVFPFWRWMRTSIPFQFEQLYKQTGKYAALAKAENTIMPNAERENLPDYLKNKIIVGKSAGANGKTSYQTADLPVMDILKSMNPRELASGMSPALKIPAEMTFNKQIFTDQPIYDKNLPKELQTVKNTNPLASLPGIKQLLGVKDVEKVNRRTGEMEPRQEISSKVAYILQNMGPITSLSGAAKRVERELENQGVEPDIVDTIGKWIKGFAIPIKTYNIDPEEAKYNQLMMLNSRLQDIINYGIPRGMIERKK